MPALLEPVQIDLIAESHETRINRLEDGLSEVSIQIATNTAHLESISKQIDNQFDSLADKVTTSSTSLSEKLNTVVEQVSTHKNTIETLTKAEQNRQDRLSNIKKWIQAGALAAFGVLVKMGFDRLFHLVK